MTELDATDPAGFPPIAGLNTSDGLRRVGGNARLYASLLQQFVDGQSDAAARILASLARGNRPEAERAAHSIKGVAGNIGAVEVQGLAGDLEKAIREQDEPSRVEELRGKLGAALGALTPSLKSYLASLPSAATPDDDLRPVDPEALKAAVKKLTALLADSDAAAADVIESENAALRSLFSPEEFQAFQRMVSGYAFDEAAEELRRATAGKGV